MLQNGYRLWKQPKTPTGKPTNIQIAGRRLGAPLDVLTLNRPS
jgi:hypothetical protein